MSTFKFKRVVTDRKSKNYGDIIEFTHAEKIPVAIQMALSEYAPFKDKYLAAITNVDVADYTASPLGEPLKGKWANNVYDARGKVTISKRDVHKDMMVRPETKEFKIKFGDTLSANGLPDFKIILFEMHGI